MTRSMTRSRGAVVTLSLCITLFAGATPAANAVFPAPANGVVVYVKQGDIWTGSWPNGGPVSEKRLTWTGWQAHSPRWSPDGQWIAYIAAGRLRVMRADGTGKRTVVRTGAASPRWVPDTSGHLRLGYVLEDEPGWGSGDIYTIELDGTARRRVTWRHNDSCDNSYPDWSADGTWLTYRRGTWHPDGSCTSDNVLRNRVTGHTRVLPDVPFAPSAGPPTFHPDSHAVSWIAEELDCFSNWATYEIATRTLSISFAADECGGQPMLGQLSWTPTGGLFEYTYNSSEDDPVGWDRYSYDARAVYVQGDAGRHSFDVQPDPARPGQ